jgi:tetratricopeptide (TPR) repeat protein
MIMKNLFLTILTAGLGINSFGQPPNYDDLLIYYADGDYEKVVDKAEKYMEDDDTKKDALPYLYSSMANFEMSKDGVFEEDFPKAYNNAIKNAGKALKNDKDGSVYEMHINYFTELKGAVLEELKNMVLVGDFSRMRGTIMSMQRLDPNDIGSQFLMAAAQYRIKDKSSAKNTIKEAQAALDAVESVEEWRDVDLEMLRIGVIEYVNYLVEIRQTDQAKKVLGKVKQWYEDDQIFMAVYDEVVN